MELTLHFIYFLVASLYAFEHILHVYLYLLGISNIHTFISTKNKTILAQQ